MENHFDKTNLPDEQKCEDKRDITSTRHSKCFQSSFINAMCGGLIDRKSVGALMPPVPVDRAESIAFKIKLIGYIAASHLIDMDEVLFSIATQHLRSGN